MKIHHQIELNNQEIHRLRREGFMISPHKIEEFFLELSKKGYTVLKSASYITGIPQSITLIKETTEGIASAIVSKIEKDIASVSEKTGIGRIFSS